MDSYNHPYIIEFKIQVLMAIIVVALIVTLGVWLWNVVEACPPSHYTNGHPSTSTKEECL